MSDGFAALVVSAAAFLVVAGLLVWRGLSKPVGQWAAIAVVCSCAGVVNGWARLAGAGPGALAAAVVWAVGCAGAVVTARVVRGHRVWLAEQQAEMDAWRAENEYLAELDRRAWGLPPLPSLDNGYRHRPEMD
jgi:hypothetical protein